MDFRANYVSTSVAGDYYQAMFPACKTSQHRRSAPDALRRSDFETANLRRGVKAFAELGICDYRNFHM
jgi:hypothetical protein